MKWLLALFVSSALAQQPSIQDLQRIITVLENQRQVAQTNHALSESKAMRLEEEVAKLQAEIEQLKKAKPDAK